MASFSALVAGLSGGVQRATVRGSAVAGDMAKLATSIALHSLSLAVPGKVVGTAALVTSRLARATSETTTSITTKSATTDGSTAAHANTSGIGASPGEMTGLSAVIAAAIAATGTAQTESRAIGLNMAKSLAVVALLSLRRSRKGTLVGFMAFSPKGDPLVTRALSRIIREQNLPGCLQL